MTAAPANAWAQGLERYSLSEPCVSLIVAQGRNRVIGVEGKLPWHLPEDLKRFKAITMNQPIIMGRKTFESIGRVLPGRKTIVLSRSPTPVHPDVWMAADPWEAKRLAATWLHERSGAGYLARPEVLILGGAQVYELFLPLAHRIYLTEVDSSPQGDALMPVLGAEWEACLREPLAGSLPAAEFRVLKRP